MHNRNYVCNVTCYLKFYTFFGNVRSTNVQNVHFAALALTGECCTVIRDLVDVLIDELFELLVVCIVYPRKVK